MRNKLITFCLVFALGFSLPFYFTSGAGAIAFITKEFGLDLIARALASRALTALGNGVINSINNLGVEEGKRGPTFVQSWKEFQSQAKTLGENQFRAQLSYTVKKRILCDDLKGPLNLAYQAANVPYIDIGSSDKYDELKQDTILPYQTRVRCTIPDKTRQEFKKDFEKGGGWETWSRMVEPQNSIIGALTQSAEELEKQRTSQETSQRNEAVAGQGFTGVKGACQKATGGKVEGTVCFKNCLTNLSKKFYDSCQTKCGSSGEDEACLDNCLLGSPDSNTCRQQCAGKTALGANSQCTFLGKTVTPANILSKAGANWLDDRSKWLVSSDELSEVLINILGAAVNKLGNFAGGRINIGEIVQKVPDFFSGASQDCLQLCQKERFDSCNDKFPNKSDADPDKQQCFSDARTACNQQCGTSATPPPAGFPTGCTDFDKDGKITTNDCLIPPNDTACVLCQTTPAGCIDESGNGDWTYNCSVFQEENKNCSKCK